MKAAVYTGSSKISLKDINKPELKGNGAIVKISGCGLCGSDIVKLKQNLFNIGAVPGHEIVGYIEEIKSDSKFKPGDRVIAGHHVPCFKCIFCENENYSMCREFKSSNIEPGGFSEYIFLSENHLNNTTFKIPENIPDTYASFTEPLACCLRAVKRAKVKKGEKVFVIGLGSIGLLMGQVLMYYGANVYGCDLLDSRIKLAQNLGFDSVYKFTNNKEVESLLKGNTWTEGVDKVFLTSGNSDSISLAGNSVRDGGTILVFASIPSNEKGFTNNDIYYRELTVLGSYSPSPEDLKNSLELIKNRTVKVNDLFNVYKLEEIDKAIEDTISNRIIKAFIEIL